MKLRVLFILMCCWCLPLGAESRALFTGEVNEQTDIFQLDLESGVVKPFIQHPADDMMPDVSADGKQVALISNRRGAHSLYIGDMADPTRELVNMSPGMGAYANPAFAPDGRALAVRYSPDPEAPFQKTQIVLVDIASRTQKPLIDCSSFQPAGGEDQIFVVDRPKWIDPDTLLFVLVEYGDPEFMRVMKSGIYRYSLTEKKALHLAGGESYFDEAGKPLGYKASMPVFRNNFITFTAIEGSFHRTAMFMPADGSKKNQLPIRDHAFFGPVFLIRGGFLYGTQDEEGRFGLSRFGEKGKKIDPVSFSGNAMEPVLVP
jgi:hypothetical protein